MTSNRLYYLLQRYSAQEATGEEINELADLVGSGQHDEEINAILDELAVATQPQEVEDEAKEMRAISNKEILAKLRHRKQVTDMPPAGRSRTMTTYWMAAAASFLILAVAAIWMFTSEIGNLMRDEPKAVHVTGRQFVQLPDGSTAVLNDNSELTYENYGETTREVYLKGEAYFDVAHDPAKPFIVRTGNVKTTVLGTAFNVKAYPSSESIVVSVVRGKVAVGDNERVYDEILPQQQIAVDTRTNDFKKTEMTARETEGTLLWRDEFFVLDKVTMARAADMIEERYGAKVIIENALLKNCNVTAAFMNNESVETVVASISVLFSADYKLEKGVFTIQGGIECNK